MLGFMLQPNLHESDRTATFLVNAFYQLGVLIYDYPFSKWVIGLLVGIGRYSVHLASCHLWNAPRTDYRLTSQLDYWVAKLGV